MPNPSAAPVATTQNVEARKSNIQPRMLARQKANGKIKDCCRNDGNLMVQGFKTNQDRPKTDMIVMTCNVCSCRHIVAGLDAGGAKKVGRNLA